MGIPHSLHSRFLLSLLQAFLLFFHCPHLTPPNYEAQTTFNPTNELHWPQPSAPSLPLVPLFSCSASPVEDAVIRARLPSSSFSVTHVLPLATSSPFAPCSHSVCVPLLSLSTQPNSITFSPLYKDARVDGLVRIHVPFSLSDLSQIEKGLGSYNGNSSTFLKKFQHITESYNLTWHYQQLSPWGSASELSLRTGYGTCRQNPTK